MTSGEEVPGLAGDAVTDCGGDPGRRDARAVDPRLPPARALGCTRLRSSGTDLDDLVQVGTIGLIKAVDRFDPTRGVDLAAFARPTVTGEIRRHLRDAVPTVRPPRRLHELNGRLRRLRRELGSRLGRPASISELAEAAGTSPHEAGEASALDRGTTVPLDDVPAGAGDPYAESEDRLFVTSCLDSLDERERRILELRFYGELSQREIARELGISQIHVSRLIERSLRTLQRRAERGPLSRIVLPVPNSIRLSPMAQAAKRIEEPKPTYSGRLLLRMPPELHAEVARKAELEHVSLNQFITGAVADAVEGSTNGNGNHARPALTSPRTLDGGSRRQLRRACGRMHDRDRPARPRPAGLTAKARA